jgi:hypothetical protein
MEEFFRKAPQINPNAVLIKGVICGYRVEEIEDDITRLIRYLDKLIDELAKGKQCRRYYEYKENRCIGTTGMRGGLYESEKKRTYCSQ